MSVRKNIVSMPDKRSGRTWRQPKHARVGFKGWALYFAMGGVLLALIVIASWGMPEADEDSIDTRPGPRAPITEDRLIGDRKSLPSERFVDTEHDRQML